MLDVRHLDVQQANPIFIFKISINYIRLKLFEP
jgi:hypothetical protein